MVFKFHQQKPFSQYRINEYGKDCTALICFDGKYTQKEKAVPIGIKTAFYILEITYFLFKKSFTASGAIIASTKV